MKELAADFSNEVDSARSAINRPTRTAIIASLRAVAAERGVRILYAAESGSRAWGFASPDSDYDVRFIYAHPQRWYLRLLEGRDTIERPIDEHGVDLAGWDVRKALRLLLKSNPALYEWLVSPIIYLDDGFFGCEAKALFERSARPSALAAHYWSIARGQWRREIEGADEVRLKKYFYVIRPLLSLRWVLDFGTPPPMSLERLREAVELPQPVADALEHLLKTKRATPEFGRGPRIAVLDAWAERQLALLAPERLAKPAPLQRVPSDDADALFQRVIGFAG